MMCTMQGQGGASHSAGIVNALGWQTTGLRINAERRYLVAMMVCINGDTTPSPYHSCVAFIADGIVSEYTPESSKYGFRIQNGELELNCLLSYSNAYPVMWAAGEV